MNSRKQTAILLAVGDELGDKKLVVLDLKSDSPKFESILLHDEHSIVRLLPHNESLRRKEELVDTR